MNEKQLINFILSNLTKEQEENLADKLLLMDKRGLDEILQDLYKNNLWEKKK